SAPGRVAPRAWPPPLSWRRLILSLRKPPPRQPTPEDRTMTALARRRVLPLLALLLTAASLAAKDNDPDKPVTPAEQYRALLKESQAAREAKSAARLDKVALRLLELAEKNPREPVAVDALLQVVRVYN